MSRRRSLERGRVVAIRVLLVDDHHIVREGLRMFLRRDPDLEVVGEAANGVQAIEMTRDLHPNVILMDLLMPVMDGISAIATICREFPETEVIALTSVIESGSVVDAVKAGAIGYVLKDLEADELRSAIKAAASGQVQLSPQATAYLMNEVHLPTTSVVLTEREMDVLRLLAKGQSNRDIASHLHVVEDTAKTHVRHILSKLNVRSRTQAVLYALHRGLVAPEQGKG